MRRRTPLPKYMQPGGFFDLSSARGNIRYIFLCLLGSFLIWNANYIFDWIDMILGLSSTPDSESTVRVRRFWASILGVGGVLTGFAKILWLYWYRKQAIKSTEGQWYDRPGLSKKDLYEGDDDK
jgi:hypothetical protein